MNDIHKIVVENTVDIIVLGDAALNRRFISPSVREVLGYHPDELLGRTPFALVHPDDAETVAQVFKGLSPTNDRAKAVFRMRHRAGHHLWIEGHYRHLPENGGVVAVLRDVTQRQQAEADLAKANAQLEAVKGLLETTLEHMTHGVAFFDGHKRLVLCNRSYAQLYDLPEALTKPGTSLETIVNHRFANGLDPHTSVEAYLASRDQLRRLGKTFDSEVRLRNGKLVLIRHHPMADGGWVATHEDITERRRTEEMLQHAQRLEAVGRLTAGIAHDFNNLLQIVGVALEVLTQASGNGDAELQQLASDAAQAVNCGGRLTQQLLTFSRRQTLQPVQVDIGALMGDMASLLGQLCGRAIRVDLVAGVGPYPCLLDAAQFRSALLNLAINARDAMPRGGLLTITIDDVSLDALQATGAQVSAGRYVRIRVEDTGHGIAAEALPHVFEPFFTTKAAGTGTGLGLSQVYGFAQQSGGSVMIAGTSEEGTAVLLLLPHAGTP